MPLYSNGLIGYVTGYISDPPVYGNGLIGYATGTITDPVVAAGRLLRAELDQASAAAGRLLRAELDSVQSAGGQLLRAQLSSTAATDGLLLRAEMSSASVPVQAGSPVTVEPYTTVTLQGSGGNSNPGSQTWIQTAGPAVTLTGTGDSRQYVVPGSASTVTLTFVYNVDGATAEVSHTVLPATETDVVASVRRPINPH